MKDKLFLIKIVTAFRNRGDLLINKSLIQNLRRYGSVRVVETGIPDDFLNGLELATDEISTSLFRDMRKGVFRKSVYFVGIPGHHFGGSEKLASSIGGLAKTVVMRSMLNIRFIKVGTSIGPITPSLATIEKYKSYFYDLYGVRDTQSLAECTPSRMQYFPDLAFLSEDLRRVASLDRDERARNNDDAYVFVSFRSEIHKLVDSPGYFQKVKEKLSNWLRLGNAKKVIVGFQVDSDRHACGELYEHLCSTNNIDIQLIDSTLSLEQSIDLIAAAETVISNRLHVLLPALILGVPHCCLTDPSLHTKIAALYSDIGAESCIHDVKSEAELELPRQEVSAQLKSIAKEQYEKGVTAFNEALRPVTNT
ncbi:polysaccharide pyruvyl transferase family protein [Roseiconus lacunae]|uniref:polysaccharide pyruvyl transferase family protein n=1 Tax=Roseiconus lacunae TaxID=2605694 RepID=UPI0030870AAB|nr:polysaccharide pyruvyl transferase family protein [Stieleria sp. HD01]